MTAFGADLIANSILPVILDGKVFTVPTVDLDDPIYDLPLETGALYADIERLDNEDLTTRTVGGAGTFDALMAGFDAHLKREFEASRITGADYTKAYVALTEAAMGNAVQYLLGRESAYWQAMAAKYQAQALRLGVLTAKVGVATAKAQMAMMSYEALTKEVEYGVTKMKLATEDVTYAAAKYNRDVIMPEQLKLVQEQAETARSQTMDTRFDGGAVVGSVGKQKALYDQQITSYQRDGEVKAAKMFIDSWITQKSIDEGLLAPVTLQNASIDAILADIKTANNLG